MLERDRPRTELLDQALAGQPAEVRARVQNILLRYDIDVENEFFLIFVAIGHLLTIVETAPENWRALFDEFEGKLDEWAVQNLRTLAAVQAQGQETERMSLSFLRLTDSMMLSSSKTSELQSTLKELSRTLSRLTSSLAEVRGESRSSSGMISGLSGRFDRNEKEMASVANQMAWIWSINLSLLFVAVGSVAILSWGMGQQRRMIVRQGERIGWLLDKANRQECLSGVKAPDDPQCLQYEL